MIDPDALIGQTLQGRHRLVRFLGQGGQGSVYEAEELVRGEVLGACAVKLLRPGPGQPVDRLMEEIAASARIDHPCVLGYRGSYEVEQGLLRGALVLALELAEGTLRDRLRHGDHLPPGEALALARDAAEALTFLHGQGAVHRDLKPENLFQSGPRWKLGDLGLLQAVERALTRATSQRGTLHYMAPETLQDQVGPSVDMWGLGVLLQEALTGALPFPDSSPQAWMASLMQAEPAISPNLPAPLAEVIRGCLVRDPARRLTAPQALARLQGEKAAADPAMTLREAARRGALEALRAHLAAGPDLEAEDAQGATPLMHAALEGQVEAMGLLLEAGADVHHESERGGTALMWASSRGQVEAVRCLLEAGAQAQREARNGWTALEQAASRGQAAAARLLIDAGAQVDHKTRLGWTALMRAASEGQVEAVELLLEAGAAVTLADPHWGYPLSVAPPEVQALLADRDSSRPGPKRPG